MAITKGSGPFGEWAGGDFNFDTSVLQAHTLYFEECPRRVRAVFNGETVADSTRVKYLHETGYLPVYYIPEEDVRMDLLRATEHTTHCPFKGDAVYWSIVVGDRVAENAVWSYPEPTDTAPPLAGYLAFYWSAIDTWYEENEQVFVHPRDPYHRVDILDSSRHVKVLINDEVVADTSRPTLLFETSLPTRYYIPEDDIRMDLIEPGDRRTQCPYKGNATYWSARVDGELVENVAWSYPDPLPEAGKLPGTLCFHGVGAVEIYVDGEKHQWMGPG